MLFVGRYLLFVVGCLLLVVCDSSSVFVVRYMLLFVVSRFVCWLWFVVCCLTDRCVLFVVCCLVFVVCCLLYVVCCLLCVVNC